MDQRHLSRCHRWAVVLAGGDGQRLQSLTRSVAGDDRPKQFCALVGGQTLLHQTLLRTGRLAPLRRTLLVLTKTHKRFYSQQLQGIPHSRLIIQPENRGTAPAILYTLVRLQHLDAQAVVAFFPSDHYVSDGAVFHDHMNIAFRAAECYSDSVVLLGATPGTPESGYGWIEPGAVVANRGSAPLRRITGFWEKPSPTMASALMDRGCLWNTFVMAGRVKAFLNVIRQALPRLFGAFQAIGPALFSGAERRAISELYSSTPSIGFCKEVLSRRPQDLVVLCGAGMGWTDLGEPSRLSSVLERKGITSERRFSNAEEWRAAFGAAAL